MDDLDMLVNTILETMGAIEFDGDVNLVSEFPNQIKDNPLLKPTLSYGVKNMSAFYDLDIYPDGPILDVTLGFTIHAPITSSGSDCRNIFISIIKYLFPKFPMMTEFGCGDLKFKRSTSTIELEGYGTVRNFM